MRGARSIAVLVGAALGAASASRPAGDSDIYWHLATARETLAHGLVRQDVFSWTVRGAQVSTDQWLGQLLYYAAYLVDGWSGVVLLRGAAIAILVALIFANAAALPGVRPITALVAMLPAIFMSQYVWSERPLLLGVACFAALLLLLRVGRSGSDRALALVVPLLALWANLHGSFALGVVLVALVAAEGAWREPARRRMYAVMVVASLGATLLTPAGVGSWTAPGFHLLFPPREIQEWARPDVRTGVGALFAVTLALVAATALITRSLPAREALILVPVALLAATAVRHTPLFAIAASAYLASRGPDALVAALRRFGVRLRPRETERPTARVFSIFSLAAAAMLAVIAIAIAPAEPDETSYPVAALAVLPPGPGLFNHYDWGGWLIWRAPATPVFIDGRFTPYRCCGVLDDYRTVISAGPGWSETLARRGIRAVLVRPEDQLAVRGIESGWTVLVRTPGFVLLRVP
ncbi:MAG TPA: hypothetical protein VGR87_13480 [Candidatus Limnocylindria bacterium]|jgi:hypothetical protein|nr:hypothetical protein [Candidatus Limnocylindria bacterium]